MKPQNSFDRKNQATLPPTARVLRLPAVMQMTGLGRSTIYALVKQGLFPPALKLSRRAVGWLETDIVLWIEEQVQKTRSEFTNHTVLRMSN